MGNERLRNRILVGLCARLRDNPYLSVRYFCLGGLELIR